MKQTATVVTFNDAPPMDVRPVDGVTAKLLDPLEYADELGCTYASSAYVQRHGGPRTRELLQVCLAHLGVASALVTLRVHLRPPRSGFAGIGRWHTDRLQHTPQNARQAACVARNKASRTLFLLSGEPCTEFLVEREIALPVTGQLDSIAVHTTIAGRVADGSLQVFRPQPKLAVVCNATELHRATPWPVDVPHRLLFRLSLFPLHDAAAYPRNTMLPHPRAYSSEGL
jgi:hypothetical protein